MSEIKENAFQIARYLDNNKHTAINKAKKGDVRNVLDLSPEDFHNATTFLSTNGYCGTTIGGDAELIWIKSAGISFVDQAERERVSLSRDAEWLLKFLFDSQTPASDNEQTMNTFGWDEKRYLNALETLKFKRYIDVQYADNKPFDIWITNDGREIVRNNFRLLFQHPSKINIENSTTIPSPLMK